MDNLKIWDALKQPPPEALKTIQGGRLKGKTDINPQWRYRVMTEQFGMCGVGWKYDIENCWTESAPEEQLMVFAKINLSLFIDGKWSEPIPGIGGSMLIVKESGGLHISDEGYKMAVTDALSVAMKMLGVAANIYAGLSDSKYSESPKPKPEETKDAKITPAQLKKIFATAKEKNYEPSLATSIMVRLYGTGHSKELTKTQASDFIEKLSEGFNLKEGSEIEAEDIPY